MKNEEITVENGKYTLILHQNGSLFECKRYGAPWRNLDGDHMVLALFFRIQELEADNVALHKQLACVTEERDEALEGIQIAAEGRCCEICSWDCLDQANVTACTAFKYRGPRNMEEDHDLVK